LGGLGCCDACLDRRDVGQGSGSVAQGFRIVGVEREELVVLSEKFLMGGKLLLECGEVFGRAHCDFSSRLLWRWRPNDRYVTLVLFAWRYAGARL